MSDHTLASLAGIWVILVVIAVLCQLIGVCVAGALLLAPVDRQFTGVLLGIFMGPIGLVIAWAIRDNELRERAAYEQRHRMLGAEGASSPSWPGFR